MKGCERCFVRKGDAFPAGKEEGRIKSRRRAWFASPLPGVSSEGSITQKSPINGHAHWAIAEC